MFSNILSIGDKIDLTKMSVRNSENNEIQYVSQIMDFTDDRQLHIAMPIEKGRLIVMDIGAKYNLCFYTKIGLYQCKCVVTNRFKHNNMFIAVIKFLTDLEKFQRRQYYRLDCLIDITYRIITDEEINDITIYNRNSFENEDERNKFYKRLVEYDKDYINAVMIDVSGGGARFNTHKIIEKDRKIMLKINFSSNSKVKTLQLMANIVTVTKIFNKDELYEYRAEFFGISNEDREFIIKFVFDEERIKRKREKG